LFYGSFNSFDICQQFLHGKIINKMNDKLLMTAKI
jgi:hypothetical protein